MSRFEGVRVADQSLQNQFSQAQLRSLKSRFLHVKKENGQVTVGDLPPLLANLKPFNVIFKEEEIKDILLEPGTDEGSKLDFDGFLRGASEDREVGERHPRKPKKAYGLEEIYRQKQEEEEKARMEKDAIIKSKKEAKEKAEARRKAQKENMMKRTRSGQPVMKYRIEHLLQTLQGSNGSQ